MNQCALLLLAVFLKSSMSYDIKLDGFLMENGRRVSLDNPIMVASNQHSVASAVVENIKSDLQKDKELADSTHFRFGEFYAKDGFIKAIVLFTLNQKVAKGKIQGLLRCRKFKPYLGPKCLSVTVTDPLDESIVEPPVVTPIEPPVEPPIEPPVVAVSKPQFMVMLVLKTKDTSINCQNTASLLQRFSNIAQTDTVLPMLSQIQCPQEVDETISGFRYVLLQFNYEADSFQKYLAYVKKSTEGAVLQVLTPQLQADESIQIVSIGIPVVSFDYSVKLDGYLTNNKKRINWSSNLLTDVRATQDQYQSFVTSVESKVTEIYEMKDAYDFHLAYFYKKNRKIKVVLSFKNTILVQEKKIRKQLMTGQSNYQFGKSELVINIDQGHWNPLVIDEPEGFGHSSE